MLIMKKAYIRFYAELNNFLKIKHQYKYIRYNFNRGTTVKHALENFNIPQTEIDLILSNGNSVTLDYKIKNKDTISIYPVFESFDIKDISRVRKFSLRNVKFIADVHLKKLAKYLRFLGFDTLYSNSFNDKDIVKISTNENRIILTCDIDLLNRRKVNHGYLVRSRNKYIQIKEVIHRFQLENSSNIFSRCLECNSSLKNISKDTIKDRVPEHIYNNFVKFKICPSCNNIYWKGSHFDNLLSTIEKIVPDFNRKNKY